MMHEIQFLNYDTLNYSDTFYELYELYILFVSVMEFLSVIESV